MLSAGAAPRLPALARPARRYLLALAIVGAATLLRLAIDPVVRQQIPLLHNQMPYLFYVAAVVVATWFTGVVGGVLAIVAGAFTGNYFFVAPRHEIVPYGEDWIAMGLFAAVAGGLVWLVASWQRTVRSIRGLHEQTLAVLEQLPVGVVIADANGRLVFGNRASERIFHHGPLSPPPTGRYGSDRYKAFRPDGHPLQEHEHPIARSLLRGEVIVDEEIHVERGDGTRAVLSVCSTPLRHPAERTGGAVVVTLSDVTEQREAAEALRQRAEELQVILDTVPAGVFVSRDPEARRIDGNLSAAQMLRLPAGTNLSKTAPDGERPTTFRVMRDGHEVPGDALPIQAALRQDTDIRDAEFDIVYEDGTTRTLFGNAAPLRDRHGRARGSVGAFVDVSERRRMESRLREQAAELERANQVKDEFLATLGHELRTPLNAIVGWSSLLVKGGLPEDVTRRAHEAIARNADAQRTLIEDVLDVSRIVSGKLRLEARQTDISRPLRAAVESLRPHAEEKGVALRTEFREGPATVLGDAARLQQIFSNLLSNAVKFTPPGGHVLVSMDRVDADVRVRVRDSGIGIAPALLPRVFERFRQADSSSTRKHAGLGLGLAIVRHLVELHGGVVEAESDGEGRGATFTVRLPFRTLHERRSPAGSMSRGTGTAPGTTAHRRRLGGIRVLVVDDDADSREVTASVLRHSGAIVEEAASGREALNRLEADPQVLLIDIAMPEMDGYSLLEEIRRRTVPAAHAPAIAVTAYAREEDRQRALSTGFQMHVAKPVPQDVLVQAVAQVMGQDVEAH